MVGSLEPLTGTHAVFGTEAKIGTEIVINHINEAGGIQSLVGEGEVVAVIGPNGAGKSTLLKTLSGLIRPYAGSVLFEGRDLTGAPPYLITRAGVAHVPEGGRLFVNMSVADNLLMGAYSNRQSLKSGVLEEIYQLFPVLRDRQGQLAGTLSGGEKQMLAIGRGLASRPRFLMLDEPSLGLAPKSLSE